MSETDGFEALEDAAGQMSEGVADAVGMVATFSAELGRMRSTLAATGQDVATLEKGLSGGLRRAFDGVVFGGDKMSDALRNVANALISSTYNAAMKPITNQLGGLLSQGVGQLVGSLLPFADGAPFSQGRVMPFAKGGIVSSATTFGMRGGTGLMGEAGPEAIMPLARGTDGKLGVQAGGGGGGVNVVLNITTPDVQGFRRSQSQIAAQMGRVLGHGARNR